MELGFVRYCFWKFEILYAVVDNCFILYVAFDADIVSEEILYIFMYDFFKSIIWVWKFRNKS